MEQSTKDSATERTIDLGPALWIAVAAISAWLTLWFVSGEFLSSLLAILAPMALVATR